MLPSSLPQKNLPNAPITYQIPDTPQIPQTIPKLQILPRYPKTTGQYFLNCTPNETPFLCYVVWSAIVVEESGAFLEVRGACRGIEIMK